MTIKEVLCNAFDNVYFAEAEVNAPFPYVVYMLDDETYSLEADNKKQNQAINGTIDLYSKYENGFELFNYMQGILTINDLTYRLNSTNYESEKGVIHFEWEVEAEVAQWLK